MITKSSRYSIEKFPDGAIIIYFHSKYGIMPYLALMPNELDEFIEMLKSCQTQIPNIIKKAFGE